MNEFYPIRQVRLADQQSIEQMGTKRKFWCRDGEDRRWLFKFARPRSGEDWSEKIASEVAGLLGLPHAVVELGNCEGSRGILSLDFTDNRHAGELVHGNELLAAVNPAYPRDGFRVSQHRVETVRQVLSHDFIRAPAGLGLPRGVESAVHLFAGYLLLDVLIGNTDRHHENWGILEKPPAPGQPRLATLAPTFDHASSLGRELSEEQQKQRLETRDAGFSIDAYANKAHSALFASSTDRKPLSTVAALTAFAEPYPSALSSWQDRLNAIADKGFESIVESVPSSLMGEATRQFVLCLLRHNRNRILKIG